MTGAPAWRAQLAAIGPLAIGLAVDEPEAGFTAALGGLNTALCVPRAGLRARLWWGSLALLGGAGALALADAASGGDARLVLLSLVWVAAGPSSARPDRPARCWASRSPRSS